MDFFFAECLICGEKKKVTKEKFENFFLNSHKIDLKLNILNINKIYSRIKCKECQSDVMNILNSDEKMIIDGDKLRMCKICKYPITLNRLSTFPKSNICSAKCAEDSNGSLPPANTPPIPRFKSKCLRCANETLAAYGREGWYICCSNSSCEYKTDFKR